MKKTINLLILAVVLATGLNAQPIFTVGPTPQCHTGSNIIYAGVTASVPATSFTWNITAPGNNTACITSFTTSFAWASYVVNCTGVYTVQLTAYNGSAVVTSQSQTAAILPSSNVSISGTSVICMPGDTATLTASGASNYTWFPGGMTGSVVYVTPSVTTIYSVSANSGCGSSNAAHIVAVQPSSATIVGSNTQCGSVNLSGSPFSNYLWLPSNTTGPSYSSGPLSPGVYCYTLVSSSSCGSLSATKCVTVGTQPTVTAMASSNTICSTQPITLTASGASSYTWFPGNLTGASVVVTPTASTGYTVTGSNGTGCNAGAATFVFVTGGLQVSSSNGAVLCGGQTTTLQAIGATNYTWSSPGNPNFSNSMFAVVSPTANTCYTVTGTGGTCPGTAVYCITIGSPTLSIFGPSSICAGNTAFLSVQGVVSATWLPSMTNGTFMAVNPTSSTCYTVLGTTFNGCQAQGVKCINVTSVSYNITNSVITTCPFQNVQIATSANSYSWTILGPNNYFAGYFGTNLNLSFNASGTYTVNVSNGSCSPVQFFIPVTVLPTPVINVNPASATVCEGTSVTFTASGAVSYTWGNTAGGSTFNTLPVTSTGYTITGTGANGCAGYSFAMVYVDTTCSDVWPGDANSDGVVSSLDVIEIGLQNNATGPARASVSIAWNAEFCNNWAGTVSTGKNKCHADCNGNGTVNPGDVGAINANLNNTHAFKPSPSSSDGVIKIVTPVSAIAGAYMKADIIMGDVSSPVINVFGITFDVDFDPNLVENGSAYLVYTSSFLNANNTSIEFDKPFHNDGKIVAATVRTDGNVVNGSGKIAEFWFKPKSDLPMGTDISLSLSNTSSSDNTGFNQAMTASGASTKVNGTVGIGRNTLANHMMIHPNPAKGVVNLQVDLSGSVHYTVTDLLGREITSGDFTGKTSVDLSAVENGVYTVKLSNGESSGFKKIVIEK